MNYGQQENARVKEQIVNGLFKELEEHPFSEIRIASLIKTAGVGRTSYYRNFDSKEDILNYYLEELIDERRQQSKQFAWTRKDVQLDLKDIFIFFREQKKRFLLLFNSGLSAYIFNYFRDTAKNGRHPDELPWNEPYLIPFFTGALPSVLFEWLKRGTPESPNEMATIVTNFLPESFFIDEK